MRTIRINWRKRIVAKDDYIHSKPHPDCLIKLMRRLLLPWLISRRIGLVLGRKERSGAKSHKPLFIYVGDHNKDLMTAENANKQNSPVEYVSVYYNPEGVHSPHAVYSISRHSEILQVIDDLQRQGKEVAGVGYDLDDTLLKGPHLWAWQIAAWHLELELPEGWQDIQKGISNQDAVGEMFGR